MYTYDDNTFSDLHKEVYGFRPRTDGWADWTSRTPRQKQELWNALCDELEDVMKEEKLAKDRKTQNFENRVKETLSLGAKTRKDAIRWIFQADNINTTDVRFDAGYACYLLGLPYSYEEEFRTLIGS